MGTPQQPPERHGSSAQASKNDNQLLLARQPILDREQQVAAFELLFRGAVMPDGDTATSQVLVNAFQELDIAQVTGTRPAYVNFTRQLILQPPPFPPQQLVVEVLEDVVADDAVLDGLRNLRAAGFTIALDDFVWRPELEPMLDLADVVKLDVLAEGDALAESVGRLQGRSLILLAEKVETHSQFDQCLELGFDLFQGYFFCQPELVHGKVVPPSRKTVLELVAGLADANASFTSLETIINQDAVLGFRVLKLVNSAAFHTRAELNSIGQALAMLGISQIRSWAMLLALAAMADKPRALCVQALQRAQMCQILGQQLTDDGEPFYMAGMLSTLDAFFDTPLAELLETLPVAPRVRAALLHRSGDIGTVLAACCHWEQGAWEQLDLAALQTLGLDPADLGAAYSEAIARATLAGPLLR